MGIGRTFKGAVFNNLDEIVEMEQYARRWRKAITTSASKLFTDGTCNPNTGDGIAVAQNVSGKVTLGTAGDSIYGFAVGVERGKAVLVDRAAIMYNSTTPPVYGANAAIGVDGSGKVQKAAQPLSITTAANNVGVQPPAGRIFTMDTTNKVGYFYL